MIKKVLFILFFISTALSFRAQDAIPTRGKEFWMGFMRNLNNNATEELKVFVTSNVTTSGTISMPLEGFNQTFNVIANETTTLIIPNNIGEETNTGLITQKGIHIETEDTVSVFAINYEEQSADGSKILPIQSIGTEYRISSYTGAGTPTSASEFLVVATEDNTEIEINLTSDSFFGIPANAPYIINLNQGETYQVLSNTNGDLTGTTIQATQESGNCRPFAVFSGTSCAEVMPGCAYCDHLFDQNFDVNTWGTDYYTVPNQVAGVYTFRVLANVDNTNITINGTNNYVLQAGQYEEFNNINYPVCVNGDQPISVTQYFQGADCSLEGDPAMLILNDHTQKIDNITFSTVESNNITYHGLNIICNSVDIGSIELDGSLLNPSIFSPFLSCPSISYAQLEITEGSHTMISSNGFTAYVFGSGGDESYAYSVGSYQQGNDIIDFVDEVFCSDSEILLEANPILSDVIWYLESDPETTLETGDEYLLTVPVVSGLYTSFGTNLFSGCEEEHSYLVEITDPPVVITENLEICKFESIQLNNSIEPSTGYYEYSWTPTTGLDQANILNPTATPLETTTYTLITSSPTGCSASVTSTVEVIVHGGSVGDITLEATPEIVCEGEEIQLLGTINEITFEDNFDPNISWGNWCNISNGLSSDACGSVTDNGLHFSGTGIRSCTTNAIDIPNGGNITFSIKFGSSVYPCDDSEEGDDVVLEYSTDGCAGTYETIQLFDEAAYPNFTQIVVQVPLGAQTANTFFRWRQLNNSGGNSDNWMLDNVYISTFDTSNYTVEWNSDDPVVDINGVTTTSNPNESQYYYLTITDDLYDCLYSDSVYIEVEPGINYSIDTSFVHCSPQVLNLNPNVTPFDSYNYSWVASDNTLNNYDQAVLIVEPSSSTNYTLTISDNLDLCEEIIDVEVIVNEITDIDLTSSESIICYGDTAQLELTINGSYSSTVISWSSTALFTQIDNNNIYASNTATATYNVEVLDSLSNCPFSDEIQVIVSDPFSLSGVSDIATCNAVTIPFEVQSDGIPEDQLDWSWSPQIGLDNYDSPNITITENNTVNYVVTATDMYNCAQQDSFLLEILPTEFNFETEELLLCLGDTFLLETGYDDLINNFLWNTLDTTNSIEISMPGIYEVQISSDLGCNTSDSIEISYHENPEISLGENTNACDGDEIIISVGSVEEDVLWNTDETTESITINQAGCYSATLTNEYGCSKSDTICYTYFENPLVCLEDSLFDCAGETILLDACNDGVTYLWNNEETSQIIGVTDPGLYTVLVTNQYNCTTEDETVVSFGESPYVTLPNDIILCEGDSAIVNLETNADYFIWNSGHTDATLHIFESGAYIVTGYNQYCQSSDQINVIVNQYAETSLPADTTLCFNNNQNGFNLTAGGGGTLYEWNTGDNNSTITVYEPGFYMVEVTTGFGCISRESIFIEEFCSGENIFIPDAFSPNRDGINDLFLVKGFNIATFDLKIFDRWGILVWQTNDINRPWDGSFFNGGYYGDSDVYNYIIEYTYYKSKEGTQTEPETKVGRITMIR